MHTSRAYSVTGTVQDTGNLRVKRRLLHLFLSLLAQKLIVVRGPFGIME